MKALRTICLLAAGFFFSLNLQATKIKITGSIPETAENGKYIVVTLVPDTTEYFELSQQTSYWTLYNLPVSVQLDSVHRVDATHVWLYLKGDRTVDYDSNISVYAEAQENAIHNYYPDPLYSDTVAIFQALNDPESISLSGSALESHEDTAHIIVTLHGGTILSPITQSNYLVSNLPAGVTKGTVTYKNDSTVSISLVGKRTNDYDSNINPSVTLLLAAYADNAGGNNLVANTGFTFIALNDPESLSISGSATEGSENNKLINITLHGGTFANPLLSASFTVTGLPQGVGKGAVLRLSDSTATLALSGNASADYDVSLYPAVTLDTSGYNDHTGGTSLVASGGFTCIAVLEPARLLVTGDAGITEGHQSGKYLHLALQQDTFVSAAIDTNHVYITGQPLGVLIGAATYIDKNHVDLLLSGSSVVDYDANLTATVHVKGSALMEHTSGELDSTYQFTAVNDIETITTHWSYAIGTNGAEATLKNDAIIAVIAGGTFNAAGVNTTNVTLSGGAAADISLQSVQYLSRDSIELFLAYDGTDFDSNIPLTVTVQNPAYDDHVNGGGNLSSSINAVALNDPESLALSWRPGQDGLEAHMNGAVVRVKINGGTFITGNINTSNITIDNTCTAYTTAGITSISSIDSISMKSFDLHLTWDGTDFDSTRTLAIRVPTSCYKDATGGTTLTGKMTLYGTADPAVLAVAWATQPGPFGREATLDTAILHVTLSGATFVTSLLTTANVSLGGDASAIGVTIGTIQNTGMHSFDIALNWNGTDFDVDKNITVNILSDAYRESTPGSLTGSIPVPATVETVTVTGTLFQETDIQNGGGVITLSLWGAYWIAADGDATHYKSSTVNGLFNGFQNLSGPISAVNTMITNLIANTSGNKNMSVVRTSNAVLTITLPAIPSYNINIDSRFQIDVPNALFTSKGDIVTSPSITVKVSAPTTATMFGGGNICNDGVSRAIVTTVVTGKPPFTLYLSLNGVHYKTITGVTGNTYMDTTMLAGIYDIDSLTDANFTIPKGSPKLSGGISVSKLPLPDASFYPLQYNYRYDTSFYDMSLWGYTSSGVTSTYSGPGVIKKAGKYYFYPLFAGLGNDTLYYTATNNNGCSTTVSAVVKVILSNTELIFFPSRTNNNYCANSTPFTLTSTNPADYSLYPYQPAGSLTTIDSYSAVIDPRLLPILGPGESYYIIYHYVYQGVEWWEYPTFTIEDTVRLDFTSSFPGINICRNYDQIKLKATPNGVFSGTGISGDINTGFSYDPSADTVAGLPRHNKINFVYTSATGCVSRGSTTLNIWDIPKPDFSIPDICVTEGDSLSKTVFINKTGNASLVSKWKWEFGDGGDIAANNVSSLANPTHHYFYIGNNTIILTAVSDTLYNGCMATVSKTINFGKKPTANFSWENECVGDLTSLTNLSNSPNLSTDSFHWSFYGADGMSHFDTTTIGLLTAGVGMPPNPRKYTVVGATNKISLMDMTVLGCSDTISKSFILRPSIMLTGDSLQTFNAGNGGWISESATTANSWKFGAPTSGIRFSGRSAGDSLWYTVVTNKNVSEHSYITSPCYHFDTTILSKPMISLDVFRSFGNTFGDGAVLQYSTDNGQNWQDVSTQDDGVNWFNTFQISDGPGGSSIGWANVIDQSWVTAKTWLPDHLQGNVRFRVAYSHNNNGNAQDGLAFDNLRISQRKRKVLLEQFSSTSKPESLAADTILGNAVKDRLEDAVAVSYHLNLTGDDPFYDFNPDDPSGRLLYYGIFRVPYMFGDGGSLVPGTTNPMIYDYYLAPKYPQVTTLESDIRKRSLEDPPFSLVVNSTQNGSVISAHATIRALKNLAKTKITLQTAIVQRDVSFRTANGTVHLLYVLRKMLPDAGGMTINQAWNAGDSQITANVSWDASSLGSGSPLRVLMFLQDAETKEVYQAAIDSSDNSFATGVNSLLATSMNRLQVYPNPASKLATILFEKPVTEKTTLEVYDMVGALRKIISMAPMEQLKQISVGDLEPGIYMLKTSEPSIPVIRLVITR